MGSPISTPTFMAKAGNIFNADGVTQFYAEGTWTPTITAGSGTPTTVTVTSAEYTRVGRQVSCQLRIILADKGTADSAVVISLPFTANGSYFCGSAREDALTGNMGQVTKNSANNTTVRIVKYDNTTFWSNGNTLNISFTYFI